MASQPRNPTGAGVSTCATVHAPPLPQSPFLSFAHRLSGSPVALSAIVVLIAFLVTAFAASAAGDDLPEWFPAVLAGKPARIAGIAAAALLLCIVLADMGVRSFAATRAEGRFLVRSGVLSPIPGPVPQLPLGNVEDWAGDGDILGAMVKMAKRFGPVFTVWFGSTPCVVVAERDMVNAIVKANHKDYDKGTDYDIARILIGNGMLTSNGEPWKCMRKASRGLFSSRALRGLALDVEKHVSESFSAITASVASSQCNAPVIQLTTGAALVDLYDHAMETFISGTCTHFYSQHLPQARIADLARLMTVLVDGMRLRMEGLHEPLHWWRVLPTAMSQHNTAMNTAATSLQRIARTWIQERRHMATAQRPADLLTAWIAAQEAEAAAGRFVGVSTRADPDRQIVDELLSILLVGHDASSACVAWTCHLLATHADVQERVFAEVDGVSDVDALQSLPFLTAVLKESMRLYPPAAVFGRKPFKDVTVGEYDIPKGTFMLVAPYITHRLTQYFGEDPETFRPDRFLDSPNGNACASNSPAPAYLPFSYGPRNCIGQSAAMVEMKVYMAKLVQQFRLSPLAPTDASTKPIAVLSGLVIRPEGGMPCLLHAR